MINRLTKEDREHLLRLAIVTAHQRIELSEILHLSVPVALRDRRNPDGSERRQND